MTAAEFWTLGLALSGLSACVVLLYIETINLIRYLR